MSRQRGISLIEVMVSLVVVVIGLLGLFRALTSASFGTTSSQAFSQAQARAQQILEAIRSAPLGPGPTFTPNTLNCLAATTANNWANCETVCRNELLAVNGAASRQACVFRTLSDSGPLLGGPGALSDRSQQRYALVYDPANLARSSWVNRAGATNRVYDAQVTICWNDDGSANCGANPPPRGEHRVTLRQASFQ